ncbi:MAG: response regulator [Chloroflexus sp.]|nr:response regulator [Chloroflexus sp.]
MAYRIVVVARANPVLRSLSGALSGDAEVQIFESANDALWSISTEPPDVVLSEIELDEMSGLDLAEIVPNFDPQTRVILWGNRLSNADRDRAQTAGVAKLLTGELNLDIVRTTIRGVLDTPASSPAPTPSPSPTVVTERVREATPMTDVESSPTEKSETTQSSSSAEQAPRRQFTPARVVLPSRAEREAAERAAREAAEREAAERAAREAAEREAAERAAREPSPARGGLAARSRAAAERRGQASASPPQAATPTGWRSDGGHLIVTEQNIAAIRSIMSQLGQDLGTQSIMLTDRAGMILVETGDKGNLPLMVVLPLLSTGFSTTGEVARQLREEDATSVYIHEGVNIDLYCFDVAQRFLLVLIFNKRVASSKIGAVWVNAKRAIRELREALAR